MAMGQPRRAESASWLVPALFFSFVIRALHGSFLEICTVEKSFRTRFTKFVASFLACLFVQNLQNQSNFLRTHRKF